MADFEQAGWANDAFRPETGKTKVMFRTVQKKDNFQTLEQKRPVFKEVVHIVKIVADPKLRIDRPVREADKEEWPREWAQWEKTRESRILGTPIESWPAISDTQKEEFRAMKLYTVEQVAGLPDSAQNMIGMGFNGLREKAKLFVTQGLNETQTVAKIRAEMSEEKAAMQKQLDEMKAMLESLTAPKKAEKVSA
jgi:hypothetical protein